MSLVNWLGLHYMQGAGGGPPKAYLIQRDTRQIVGMYACTCYQTLPIFLTIANLLAKLPMYGIAFYALPKWGHLGGHYVAP